MVSWPGPVDVRENDLSTTTAVISDVCYTAPISKLGLVYLVHHLIKEGRNAFRDSYIDKQNLSNLGDGADEVIIKR